MFVVSNASPLILLARMERFELLLQMFDRIVIPEAVYAEVVTNSPGRPGAVETQKAVNDWIEVHPIQQMDLARSLLTKLGWGESEAITLALENNADLVLLDDRKARIAAEFMGLQVRGTVGLLIQAYRRGMIENLEQALDELKKAGVRISDAVYKAALNNKKEET